MQQSLTAFSYRIGALVSMLGVGLIALSFFFWPFYAHNLFGQATIIGPPLQIIQAILNDVQRQGLHRNLETGNIYFLTFTALPYFTACIIFILDLFALFVRLSRFVHGLYLGVLIFEGIASLPYLILGSLGPLLGFWAMIIGFIGMCIGYSIIIKSPDVRLA